MGWRWTTVLRLLPLQTKRTIFTHSRRTHLQQRLQISDLFILVLYASLFFSAQMHARTPESALPVHNHRLKKPWCSDSRIDDLRHLPDWMIMFTSEFYISSLCVCVSERVRERESERESVCVRVLKTNVIFSKHSWKLCIMWSLTNEPKSNQKLAE